MQKNDRDYRNADRNLVGNLQVQPGLTSAAFQALFHAKMFAEDKLGFKFGVGNKEAHRLNGNMESKSDAVSLDANVKTLAPQGGLDQQLIKPVQTGGIVVQTNIGASKDETEEMKVNNHDDYQTAFQAMVMFIRLIVCGKHEFSQIEALPDLQRVTMSRSAYFNNSNFYHALDKENIKASYSYPFTTQSHNWAGNAWANVQATNLRWTTLTAGLQAPVGQEWDYGAALAEAINLTMMSRQPGELKAMTGIRLGESLSDVYIRMAQLYGSGWAKVKYHSGLLVFRIMQFALKYFYKQSDLTKACGDSSYGATPTAYTANNFYWPATRQANIAPPAALNARICTLLELLEAKRGIKVFDVGYKPKDWGATCALVPILQVHSQDANTNTLWTAVHLPTYRTHSMTADHQIYDDTANFAQRANPGDVLYNNLQLVQTPGANTNILFVMLGADYIDHNYGNLQLNGAVAVTNANCAYDNGVGHVDINVLPAVADAYTQANHPDPFSEANVLWNRWMSMYGDEEGLKVGTSCAMEYMGRYYAPFTRNVTQQVLGDAFKSGNDGARLSTHAQITVANLDAIEAKYQTSTWIFGELEPASRTGANGALYIFADPFLHCMMGLATLTPKTPTMMELSMQLHAMVATQPIFAMIGDMEIQALRLPYHLAINMDNIFVGDSRVISMIKDARASRYSTFTRLMLTPITRAKGTTFAGVGAWHTLPVVREDITTIVPLVTKKIVPSNKWKVTVLEAKATRSGGNTFVRIAVSNSESSVSEKDVAQKTFRFRCSFAVAYNELIVADQEQGALVSVHHSQCYGDIMDAIALQSPQVINSTAFVRNLTSCRALLYFFEPLNYDGTILREWDILKPTAGLNAYGMADALQSDLVPLDGEDFNFQISAKVNWSTAFTPKLPQLP